MHYPDIIILAGGLGTRLREAVSDLPKVMAPISNKPFLEYLLNYIDSHGFQHVILSTGYMSQTIEQYFRQEYRSIRLSYSVETEPLGTGGAIKLAVSKVETPHFIVMNGDTFFKINLQKFFQKHIENLPDASIALRYVENASRYGQVEINNQSLITRFREKSTDQQPGLINGGVYIINTKMFRKLSLPDKFSFETDWLQKCYATNEIMGQVYSDYFLDIGIPEDYLKAQKEIDGL